MIVKAKLNYLRISSRKTRLVADLIRGKSVLEAQAILNFIVKKSKEPFLKLLNQAVNNAQNSFQLDEKNLYISKITVDEGPKLKRWRPRSRGQAYEIQKKTSHISIVLDQIITKPVKKKKKQDKEEKKEQEKPLVVSKNLENDKIERTEKAKLRPENEKIKPKTEKGIKRIFKRKAF